jgi:phage-related minor tail protein
MSSDQQKIADIMSQNALLAQQRILKESMELGLDAEGNQQTISLERQLQIKKEIAAANDILITGAQSLIDKGREFNTGWTQAFEQYRSDAENAAAQSKTYFDTFTKGFEDAFVKLVQTGKLSFKDLANSLIADFARIQARKALTGVFDMGGGDSKGNGFSFGTLLSSIGGLFKANGGQVQGDSPYIVGERGPELFVPQSAGKIIPNNALGGSSSNTVNNTAVTYSIQAVDASSFRALLARDPEFIHNVAEQGRRSLPIRSRR